MQGHTARGLPKGYKYMIYKREQIENDFQIATKGFTNKDIEKIKYIAIAILENSPDNKYRDFAISHLLQTVEMLYYSNV